MGRKVPPCGLALEASVPRNKSGTYAIRSPIYGCLVYYLTDQTKRGRMQTLEQWAIAGVKNPQPLLDWYAKRAA